MITLKVCSQIISLDTVRLMFTASRVPKRNYADTFLIMSPKKLGKSVCSFARYALLSHEMPLKSDLPILA